jgi:integrase/recombinase XerC/integrase/recombinase XerD
MATIHQLHGDSGTIKLQDAVDAFLAEIDSPGTRRSYVGTLRAMAAELGPDIAVGRLAAPDTSERVVGWFHARWDTSAPATFNRNLDAIRSAIGYWTLQSWVAVDPTRAIRRRAQPADRTRALPKAKVERLLTCDDIALRERVFWRLLYESAARAAEVLALDVPDLDLPNRQAKVRRKGGAADIIHWRTGTARILPRLLAGRRCGPVFLTDRKARVALAPADIDPGSGKARLSYRRAAEVFEETTEGWTLHQLRHSALTHAAEDGANTPMLMGISGHTSVRSLAKYARVSPEAVARWNQQHDPDRRR